MRRLLPSRLNSRLASPSQRSRAWLALWAQGRRRGRLAASTPELEPSGLLAGLVGYYNLDEAGDDPAADAAEVMGDMDVWASSVSASVPGPGSHLARTTTNGLGDFTGWRQRVNFDAFTGVPFAVNFWIFQNSNGGQYPFDCTGGISQGFTCFLATDGMYINLYSFNAEEYQSPGTISTSGNYGQWVMFTLVWTGSEYCYYENGSLMATDAFSEPGFDVGVTPFEISTQFLPVDGAMALFGVWARALTSEEVEQLYNNGEGLAFAELT